MRLYFPSAGSSNSEEVGAAIGKQFFENRTMTPIFVLAVTTDGKTGLMRQGCEQIKESGCFGLVHLRAELALEGVPY